MKPSKWKILETWNNYIRVEIYLCVCTIAFLFTCQCSSTAIPYTKSGYYLWIEEGQNNESDFETRSGPTGQQKSGFGDIWRFILPNKDEFKVQTKSRESGIMNTKSWPWFKFSRSSHYLVSPCTGKSWSSQRQHWGHSSDNDTSRSNKRLVLPIHHPHISWLEFSIAGCEKSKTYLAPPQ